MDSAAQQKAWLYGIGVAVAAAVFFLVFLRGGAEEFASTSCWSGASDAQLASGLSCELVTGAGVGGGTCAREFGGEALSRDGSPTKLRVCVGAALFVQKLHWFFYLAGAAALGYWAYSSTIKGQGVTPPTGATGTT